MKRLLILLLLFCTSNILYSQEKPDYKKIKKI